MNPLNVNTLQGRGVVLAVLLQITLHLSAQSPCFDPTLLNPNAICPTIYDPVCGCNGVTYGNACEAANFGGVSSWTPGPCPVAGCPGDCYFSVVPEIVGNTVFGSIDSGPIDPIFPDEVRWSLDDAPFGPDQETFIAQSSPGRHVLCAAYTKPGGGVCTACKVFEIAENCQDSSVMDPGFFCTAEWNPVCGCDGQTYPNPCVAEKYNGITEWSYGACPNQCYNPNWVNPVQPCVENYDPVCGCDGVTYPNPCYALTYYGMREWKKGPCCNPNNCKAFFWLLDVDGLTVTLNDASLNAEGWYLDFGDGSNHSGAFYDFKHTYEQPGVYSICLSTSNFAGTCSDKFCMEVVVGATGTTSPGKPDVQIAPNPARDFLRIRTRDLAITNLTLTDLVGRILLQNKPDQPETLISVRELPAGIYLLKVETARGVVLRKVVID